MDYTQNLHLPQWEADDRIMMDDFNEAFAKIDEGMSGGLKIATGSYIGNGLYGAEHPNTLNFDFAPKMVIVFEDTSGNYYTIFLPGENHYHRSHSASNQFGYILVTSLNENRLSYYGTTGYSGSNAVSVQGNRSGTTYYYLAIG